MTAFCGGHFNDVQLTSFPFLSEPNDYKGRQQPKILASFVKIGFVIYPENHESSRIVAKNENKQNLIVLFLTM